jgi:hypothetical protein
MVSEGVQLTEPLHIAALHQPPNSVLDMLLVLRDQTILIGVAAALLTVVKVSTTFLTNYVLHKITPFTT